MIVDTSALVAVTFRKPGHQELVTKLTRTPSAGIGTPTLAATGLVLAARLVQDRFRRPGHGIDVTHAADLGHPLPIGNTSDGANPPIA